MFIIVATGLINIISSNMDARRKEMVTLYSFGMSKRQMFSLYCYESFYIAFISSILATVFGFTVVYLLVNYGVDYSIYFEKSDLGMPFDGKLYGMWRIDSFIIALIIGVLFTVLSTLLSLFVYK